MHRVPSGLTSSVASASKTPLVPTPTIPHADAIGMPAEWEWVEQRCQPRPETVTATFTPQGYEKDYSYPLLVWLHDDRSNERTLSKLMPMISSRNFVAAAPRGVVEMGDAYGWDQSVSSIDASIEAVAGAIETAVDRFNVHASRIFVAGVGSGGTMAMRLVQRHPDWFAGAATLDGPVPTDHRPLGRLNELRHMSLLLSASRHSGRYCERAVCSDLTLLHSAGCQVAVRQYPGDDDLTTAMLADLNRWVMDLVCG